MPNKYIKICSTSLITREAKQYNEMLFTPTKMAKVKKMDICWQGRGQIGTLIYYCRIAKWCSQFGKQSGSSSEC